MVQLRDDFEKIQAAGLQLVGVSYDSVDVLKKFSDEQEIPFLLLSDEESQVIRDYGLHFKDGLPHPGTVVVDSNGVIRAKLFREGYVKRHETEELIAAAEMLQQVSNGSDK